MVNLLLPVDFSDITDHLVETAIEFAQKVNGKIYLLHVTSPDIGFIIGDVGFQYFPEIEKAEVKSELEQLNHLEKKIIDQGILSEHLLKQGEPTDTIIDFSKEKNADYIVMGTHGKGGFLDMLIGSVTKSVIKKSKIPVLVIPLHS